MKVALFLALLVALLSTKETFSVPLSEILGPNLVKLQGAVPISGINDVAQSAKSSGDSAGNSIALTQTQKSGKGLILGQIAAVVSLLNTVDQQKTSADASGGTIDGGPQNSVVDNVNSLLGGSGKEGLLDGVVGDVVKGTVGDVVKGPVGGVLGGGKDGLLDGVLGTGGLLDGVVGDVVKGPVGGVLGGGKDGLLDGVLGTGGLLDGVVGDVVKGPVGGVLGGGKDGLLDGVLGTGGLLDGVVGDVVKGPVGGVLGGGKDGLLDGVLGTGGLLDGVLGTGGLLGGVLGGNDGGSSEVVPSTSAPILPPPTTSPIPPYNPLPFNSGSGIPAYSANTAGNTVGVTQKQNADTTGSSAMVPGTGGSGNFVGLIQSQNDKPGGKNSSDGGGLLQNLIGPLVGVNAAVPVSVGNKIEQNANAGPGSSDCAGNTIGLEQSSGGNSAIDINLAVPVSVLNSVKQNSNCNGVAPTVRPPTTLPPTLPPITLPPTLPPTRLSPYKYNKYPYGSGVAVPGSVLQVPGSGVPVPGGGVPAPGNDSPVPGNKPPGTLPSNAANTVGVFQTQNAAGSDSLINVQLSALLNLLNQISQTAQSGGAAENTVGVIQQQGSVPDDAGSGLLGKLLSLGITLPVNIGNTVTQESNAAGVPNIKPAEGTGVPAPSAGTASNFVGVIQQQNDKPGGKNSSDGGGLLQNLIGPLVGVNAAVPVSVGNKIEQNANAGPGSSDCAGNTIGLEQSSGGNSAIDINLAVPVSVLNSVKQNSNCNGVAPTVRPPTTLPPTLPPITLPPTLPPTRLPPYKYNKYPYGSGMAVPGSGVLVPGGGVPAPGNGSPVPGSKPPGTLPSNAANTVGVFQTQNAAGSDSLINVQLSALLNLLNQISQTAQSGGAAENTVGVIQQQGSVPDDAGSGLLGKLLSLGITLPVNIGNTVTQESNAAGVPNIKPAEGTGVPAPSTGTASNFVGVIQQQNDKPGGKNSSDGGGLLQNVIGPLVGVNAAVPVSVGNKIEQNANAGPGSSDCAGNTIGLEQSSGGNSAIDINLAVPVSVLNSVKQNSNCNGVAPTVRPPTTLPPTLPPITLPPTLPPTRLPPYKYNKYPYGSGMAVPGSGVLVPGGGVPAPGNGSPVPGSKPPGTLPSNAANTVGVFQTQNAAGSDSLINVQLSALLNLLNQISQTAQSGGAAENTVGVIQQQGSVPDDAGSGLLGKLLSLGITLPVNIGNTVTQESNAAGVPNIKPAEGTGVPAPSTGTASNFVGVIQQQSAESRSSTGSVPAASALPKVPIYIPPPYLPTYLPPALPPTLPPNLPPTLPPIMLPNRRCYRRYCKKWRTAPRYFCCKGGKCPDIPEPGKESYPSSSYNLKPNPYLVPRPDPNVYITPNKNPNEGSYVISNQNPKDHPDVSVYLGPEEYPNPMQLLT